MTMRRGRENKRVADIYTRSYVYGYHHAVELDQIYEAQTGESHVPADTESFRQRVAHDARSVSLKIINHLHGITRRFIGLMST